MAITPFIQSHHNSTGNIARHSESIPLQEMLDQVHKLEADHRAKGITLSGRIVHVCHYLPVTCTLTARASPSPSSSGVISPPLTPPRKAADVGADPNVSQSSTSLSTALAESTAAAAAAPSQAERPTSSSGQWLLNTRWGHSAMISGIQSLSKTHAQVIVGWTGDLGGDIHTVGHTPPSPGEKDKTRVPLKDTTEEERKELERELTRWKMAAADGSEDDGDSKGTSLVPVWLDDKVAHAHYDGYCKTSCVTHTLLIFPNTLLTNIISPLQPSGLSSTTSSGKTSQPTSPQPLPPTGTPTETPTPPSQHA